jgi:hypothetical protein
MRAYAYTPVSELYVIIFSSNSSDYNYLLLLIIKIKSVLSNL